MCSALYVSCMTYYVFVFWSKRCMTATRRAFSTKRAYPQLAEAVFDNASSHSRSESDVLDATCN